MSWHSVFCKTNWPVQGMWQSEKTAGERSWSKDPQPDGSVAPKHNMQNFNMFSEKTALTRFVKGNE